MSLPTPDALVTASHAQLLPSQHTSLKEMQAASKAVAEARRVHFEQPPPAAFTELPQDTFMQHMQGFP